MPQSRSLPIVHVRGVAVPSVGLGTFRMSSAEAARAVRQALEVGYRHVDTASSYENEDGVGEALKGAGIARDDLWVTTKVWFTDARPDDVRASVDDSRRRLGLDHLDLVLLHWPAPDVPLADTLGALAALREQGVIRELGVSNFPPGLLTEAVEIAPVFCNQVEFHPLLGQDRLLELCRRHDVLLTAYAPLANGAVGDEPVLADVATRHGRTPGQAALRWLLDHDQVAVIPKASSLDHQRENLDLDFRLSDEDRAAIDALPKDRRLYTPGFAPDWDA